LLTKLNQQPSDQTYEGSCKIKMEIYSKLNASGVPFVSCCSSLSPLEAKSLSLTPHLHYSNFWHRVASCLSSHPSTVTHILHTPSRLNRFKHCLHHIMTLLKYQLWIALSNHTKQRLFSLDVNTIHKLFPSSSSKFIYCDLPTNTSKYLSLSH